MTKICILGGSFDPPHMGHLWMARLLKEQFSFDVVSLLPCSDKAAVMWGKTLTDGEKRLLMCYQAVKDFYDVTVEDADIRHDFIYTYETVDFLRQKYPAIHQIWWAVGSDWDHTTFKNFEQLQKQVAFVRIERPGHINDIPVGMSFTPEIQFLMSSSDIRKRIRENKDVTGLMPHKVADYALSGGFYVKT
jgi:nicotinate-nucleotide adenylyltransferase